ncbi:DUF4265 domain-containing protein [Aurantivibrio infirmus]
MQALQVIELVAGYDPQGQAVIERLQIKITDDDACQLVKSPAFIKGIASGDVIKLDPEDGKFEIIQRGGNLSIRIFCRGDVLSLSEQLTPQLEKLGGDLDLETERMLVYSIHVSCGFKTIEDILNKHVGENTQSAWQYGNVYDPSDGTTPLNWWNEILSPE